MPAELQAQFPRKVDAWPGMPGVNCVLRMLESPIAPLGKEDTKWVIGLAVRPFSEGLAWKAGPSFFFSLGKYRALGPRA